MTFNRFVGTGCFLIRYSNDHRKETHRQLNKFRDYFEGNIIQLIKKN